MPRSPSTPIIEPRIIGARRFDLLNPVDPGASLWAAADVVVVNGRAVVVDEAVVEVLVAVAERTAWFCKERTDQDLAVALKTLRSVEPVSPPETIATSRVASNATEYPFILAGPFDEVACR